MLTTFSPTTASSCSDLRYRATHLTQAAETLRQVLSSIPGPETRAGFHGIVRDHFDAMLRDRMSRITDAELEIEGAARQLRGLADEAERQSLGIRQ